MRLLDDESVQIAVKEGEGQKVAPDRVQQAYGEAAFKEALTFFTSLMTIVRREISTKKYERWQGYFAISLLAINLRQGCVSGVSTFDGAAHNAQLYFNRRNLQPTVVSNFVFIPVKEDITKGAELAQTLLDEFEPMVHTLVIDRLQAYFAVALMTIEFRVGCPTKDGGASLFDNAANAAWDYFEQGTKG